MTSIPAHRLIGAENGLIDRGIFTSRDIFEEEQECIFTRAWLFIGHGHSGAGRFRLDPDGDRAGYPVPGSRGTFAPI